MQKLVVTLLLVVTSSLFSNTFAQSSKVEGTYSYIAENEYEGDRTGTIEITKSEAKFNVVVTPEDSYAISLTNVKVNKNTVTGLMNMEGNEIELSMKINKDKVEGVATLPDYSELDFTATRKKK